MLPKVVLVLPLAIFLTSGVIPVSRLAEAGVLENLVSWSEPGQRIWDEIISRILFLQRRGRKSVCYDSVGCFHVQGRMSHVRPVPDHPRVLNTAMWLFTRRHPAAQLLNKETLSNSGIDPQLPGKILLHGYGGSDKSAKIKDTKDVLLQVEDANVIVVDWQAAAKGQYTKAVSNAELVGRQVVKLLVTLVNMGTRPQDIHVIGFSLGAQVAGFIGESFKAAGYKLGRITGLDPASFLFEDTSLPLSRRLDREDAQYVEVIHTDSSRIWSDGFGVLAPIGHVDYYPNGGIDQPGCQDSYVGALAYRLNNNANSKTVCSHKRVWGIFLEVLRSKDCQFVGFSCPGLKDFARDFVRGHCFRSCTEEPSSCGVIGQRGAAQGALYLLTRDSEPFCGQQLRAAVEISHQTLVTRGLLQLKLRHRNTSTLFTLSEPLKEVVEGGHEMGVVAAAFPGSVSVEHTPVLNATLIFTPSRGMRRLSGPQDIHINKISVSDHLGNSWQYCKKDMILEDMLDELTPNSISILLSLEPCIPQ